MIETLATTLIVIFCVLIFLAQSAGIASFFFLLSQNRKLAAANAQLLADAVQRDANHKKVEDLFKELVELTSKGVNAHAAVTDQQKKIEDSLKEVVNGQFQLANLTTEGIKATTEYVGKTSKAMTDSVFDLIEKNTDDVLKLNTENAQKVYDSLYVNIQMMNSLMSAMGYRPTGPVEPGLQDPKRGQNYSAPPAPSEGF
jgi:hypothetical protein